MSSSDLEDVVGSVDGHDDHDDDDDEEEEDSRPHKKQRYISLAFGSPH